MGMDLCLPLFMSGNLDKAILEILHVHSKFVYEIDSFCRLKPTKAVKKMAVFFMCGYEVK